MIMSVVADAIVAVLLVATIGYAAVLNRRLGVLRGDRAKLEELIQNLAAAAHRAESGVAALRNATEDIGQRLNKRIEDGHRLRDDLNFLLERGTGIADRLEGTIRARRDEGRPEPAASAKREPRAELQPRGAGERHPGRTEPRLESNDEKPRVAAPSRAERDLLRALTGR